MLEIKMTNPWQKEFLRRQYMIEDDPKIKMGEISGNTQRKSRVWVCSAQLVYCYIPANLG
jgi:hypothetical protein